jgi:ribonuclease T1
VLNRRSPRAVGKLPWPTIVAVALVVSLVLISRWKEQPSKSGTAKSATAKSQPASGSSAATATKANAQPDSGSVAAKLETSPSPSAAPSASTSAATKLAKEDPASKTSPSANTTNSTKRPQSTGPPAAPQTLIRNVTLKDQSGRTIYRGDVDLAPTLARIERGERHPHRNDGSVFRNLEQRLPRQPSGYYREYVVPVPDPDYRGPGPQRLVMGRGGEIYFTYDHYQSFRRIQP